MLEPRRPRQLPTGIVGRFIAGLSYPFEGFAFIRAHKLWRVCLWIVLVDIVVFVLLAAGAVALVKPLLATAGTYLASTFAVQSEFAAGLVTLLTWIMWTVMILIAVGLSGVALVLVGQALASPFLDTLSEKVESIVVGTPELPLSASRITRAILMGLSDLFWGVLTSVSVYVPLFLLGLIPGVGTIPASVLSYTFAAMLAAHEFVGLPLTRRFVNYGGRWRVVRQNGAIALGFGATTLLLLVIPGAGFFVLPFATVGGTLLYCDLVASGRVSVKPFELPRDAG